MTLRKVKSLLGKKWVLIGVIVAIIIFAGYQYWQFTATQKTQLSEETPAEKVIFEDTTLLFSRNVPAELMAVKEPLNKLIDGLISTGHREVIATSRHVDSTGAEKIIILSRPYPVVKEDKVFAIRYKLIHWSKEHGSMFICFITDKTFKWRSRDRGLIDAHGVGYSQRGPLSESWEIFACGPDHRFFFAVEKDIPSREGEDYVLTIYHSQELSDAMVFAIYFKNCKAEIVSFGYAKP